MIASDNGCRIQEVLEPSWRIEHFGRYFGVVPKGPRVSVTVSSYGPANCLINGSKESPQCAHKWAGKLLCAPDLERTQLFMQANPSSS